MADGKDKDAAKDAGKDPPPAGNAYQAVRFTIEFGNEQNARTLCTITRREYRGWWKNSNLRGRVPDERFARMPDLPGHRIVFDGARRAVSFVDPLDTPEFRDVLLDAQDVLRALNWGDEPDEAEVFADLADDGLKEWAYWARRWVDNGQAVELPGGRVPAMAAVMELPGRVRYNQFDMTPNGRDEYPDLKRIPPYRPPAPPRKKRMKRAARRREDG